MGLAWSWACFPSKFPNPLPRSGLGSLCPWPSVAHASLAPHRGPFEAAPNFPLSTNHSINQHFGSERHVARNAPTSDNAQYAVTRPPPCLLRRTSGLAPPTHSDRTAISPERPTGSSPPSRTGL